MWNNKYGIKSGCHRDLWGASNTEHLPSSCQNLLGWRQESPSPYALTYFPTHCYEHVVHDQLAALWFLGGA